MRYRLQYRRYRLPFRAPVRTAHGAWSEREGLLVRLEAKPETGDRKPEDPDHSSALSGLRSPVSGIGYGEAAPVPHFSSETVDEDEAACRRLGEWVESDALADVPVRLACLRHALANALPGATAPLSAGAKDYLPNAALLPAGRAALAQIAPRAEFGFRVFKWKVGVGDFADELSLLDDVCAALPSGAKLRLDANGAWDRRRAERWLERCADRPVEFVEQPCLASATDGEAAQRKNDDVLLGLASDYPTPIALDESLVGDGDVERWLGAGWKGIFVIKLALLGEVTATLERLEKAKAAVVFSSALETAVGAATALRTAFRWRGEVKALGFGVWPLFADRRFDGPMAAPFIRAEDVERLDVEAAWNALS